jgi:hypothetical protein
MRKSLTVLIAAAAAYAGGFYLELGNPSANSEAKSMSAVLVARLTGCHEPEKATIEGSAEGLVSGKRQSIPLKLTTLTTPGMYAVTQQWPNEGNWVVRLVATQVDGKTKTSVVVRVNGNSFERAGAKYMTLRVPTSAEVDQMLGISE